MNINIEEHQYTFRAAILTFIYIEKPFINSEELRNGTERFIYGEIYCSIAAVKGRQRTEK